MMSQRNKRGSGFARLSGTKGVRGMPGGITRSKALTQRIAQAAHDTKAENIVVLDLKKVGGFTDYFVIATGTSDRQVQAIADRITEALKKQNPPIRPLSIEGYEKGHWILLDYGGVITHVFYEEARTFYGLEKLWGDAPRLKLKLT